MEAFNFQIILMWKSSNPPVHSPSPLLSLLMYSLGFLIDEMTHSAQVQRWQDSDTLQQQQQKYSKRSWGCFNPLNKCLEGVICGE